jgi:hypothetical protein
MNVAPIFLMASAVIVFVVTALTIGTIFGVALGQARLYLSKKT